MKVYVVEYTDTDGKTSAQGVYVSETLALEYAVSAAQEIIDEEYADDVPPIRVEQTVIDGVRVVYMVQGDDAWLSETWEVYEYNLIEE